MLFWFHFTKFFHDKFFSPKKWGKNGPIFAVVGNREFSMVIAKCESVNSITPKSLSIARNGKNNFLRILWENMLYL